ncbi:MAG: hypothetical protein GF308_01000 [Candidatus Heimdallarchaeota archaeon]|nr:hypothetical protein [Candidatus Heimdallarchaeota archaeon]
MFKETNKNAWIGFALSALLILGAFVIFFTPFYVNRIDKDHYRNIYFGGSWKEVDGEDITTGLRDDLENFPAVTPNLIFIGMIITFVSSILVSVIITKRNLTLLWYRVISGLVSLGAILGMIGTIFFLQFYQTQKAIDSNPSLGIGFYLSAVIFGLFILVGIVAQFLPYEERAQFDPDYPYQQEDNSTSTSQS